MTTFIVLCRFEDGVDLTSIGRKPKATAKKLMKNVGGGAKLESLWVTTGQYDMVAVVDAPDTGSALTFLMAFSSLGRVRTMTLTADKAVDATVQRAIDAKTNIGGGKTNIGAGGNG
jgi:uncharacterized protein with GYD domain